MIFPTPLIILAGKAGSGKDTLGSYLATTFNGVCIAQADPMKQFIRQIFDFSDDQLWGESDLRNIIVPFTPHDIDRARAVFYPSKAGWLTSLRCNADENADYLLTAWFEELWHSYPDGISPRIALQSLGTEWGRKVSPNLWIAHALAAARKLLAGGYRYSFDGGLRNSSSGAFDYAIISDGRFRNEILRVRHLGGLALRLTRSAPNTPFGIPGHESESLDTIPSHFFSHSFSNNGDTTNLFARVAGFMRATYDDNRGFDKARR